MDITIIKMEELNYFVLYHGHNYKEKGRGK